MYGFERQTPDVRRPFGIWLRPIAFLVCDLGGTRKRADPGTWVPYAIGLVNDRDDGSRLDHGVSSLRLPLAATSLYARNESRVRW
jgi:hypothetical protein